MDQHHIICYIHSERERRFQTMKNNNKFINFICKLRYVGYIYLNIQIYIMKIKFQEPKMLNDFLSYFMKIDFEGLIVKRKESFVKMSLNFKFRSINV